MKKMSRILAVLLFEVIALIGLWPGSTVVAQRVAAPLDKNDPEIRAVLAELEADIEKARVANKIAGLSVAIVYDQDGKHLQVLEETSRRRPVQAQSGWGCAASRL